jgi:tetratricopeptide (TPR) repeat protein
MLGIILVVVAAGLTVASLLASERASTPIPSIVGRRMERLWSIAQNSLRQKKYLSAEKALLTILKLDQKNAPAYNHLGILYSRQREYKDAIECFEIASSINASATTLHNLGLVYYETENYEKALVALENALELDDNFAARRIAYAKVLEKLNRSDEAIKSMEEAIKMEKSFQSLHLLADMYEHYGRTREARLVRKQLLKMKKKPQTKHRIKRPGRVVY